MESVIIKLVQTVFEVVVVIILMYKMQRFIAISLLVSLVYGLSGCDHTLYLSNYRSPLRSEIEVSKNYKTICVVTPDLKQPTILSVSFKPTSCVKY